MERLGLGRKKARPVGQQLERGAPDDVNARRMRVLAKVLIFLALAAAALVATPREEVFEYSVQVGDEWRKDDLVAPFEFPIYKEPSAVEREIAEVRLRTPPIFGVVPDARERLGAQADTLRQQLQEVFDAYASFRLNQTRGRSVEASADSARYLDLRRLAWLKMTPDLWRILIDDYAARVPGLTSASRGGATGPRLDEQLVREAVELNQQLINIGVLDVPLDTVVTSQLVVRNEAEITEVLRDRENVFGKQEAFDYAQEQFARRYAERPDLATLGNAIFSTIFQPSLVYRRSETLRQRAERQDAIKPTRGRVGEGETVIRQGERVTSDIKRKLISLERAQKLRSGERIVWRMLAGQAVLILAIFTFFFLYLYLLRRQIFEDNRYVLLIALLFMGIIGLFGLAVRMPDVAMYAVPVAIVSVLLTVMFDSRVGLFGTITLALLGGLILRADFEFAFATLFAGGLGVFSVRDIKNRGQFFLSAGIVLLGYVIVIGGSHLVSGVATDTLQWDLLLVLVNSILLVMAYPLLWVFERSFGITTDLTLLELSDTNRPVLKELSLRAPGTFNHVLQVANLAEAAADRIGANALLARVGALYHDVGKMLKPEYFVENQRAGENPHDTLKPRMSALIIASHVKEGLEIGRQYNLPKRVLDFVPMHHGTTRIEYFYRKACELREPDAPLVQESEFRYPGPRPNTKETGILMLADSVEAASRSLASPTHKRLETLIDMIFKARIEDGQLSDTDLTFQDLALIKDTFLAMLLGIYHVRVKYPGQEGKGDGPPPRPGTAAEVDPSGRSTHDTRSDADSQAATRARDDSAERPRRGAAAATPTDRAAVERDGAEDETLAPEPGAEGPAPAARGDGTSDAPAAPPGSDEPVERRTEATSGDGADHEPQPDDTAADDAGTDDGGTDDTGTDDDEPAR